MSNDKSVEKCEIEHRDDLSIIGQNVVDAVFRHNGMIPPGSPALLRPPRMDSAPSTTTGKQMAALLETLEPDMGYDGWLHVAMALSHETGNGDEGYEIFDEWSSKGSKYEGPDHTLKVWQALKDEPEHPITIGTLIKMVNDAGHDASEILMAHRDRFTKIPCESAVTAPKAKESATPVSEVTNSPLDRYSLTGSSSELEKRKQDEVYILDDIALIGQATALYASPNCGKTLAVISMLSDAIADKRINAGCVYYINADDNLGGLIDKVKIAEDFGFSMIGDGFRGFRADMLLGILQAMIESDTAAGSILIIDTAKRFTDLMSKRATSEFTALNRRFVSQGGTVIALAHVNKKKTDAGKSVYAGTSDIIDDFDCAYVIELLDDGISSGRRVIAFENKKSRGSVASVAHFSYLSPDCVGSYRELLDSFCRIDADDAKQAATAAEIDADGPMIDIVKAAISKGSAAKKDLIAALREQAEMSRGAASTFIERYCGDDTTKHLWTFERKNRGAHRYRFLQLNTAGENS